MQGLSYPERLTVLKFYSLQCRRERYIIIYVWKILEYQVPNFSPPICFRTSDRRGRACITSHTGVGRLGTLAYNSFRWRAIRMFNYPCSYVIQLYVLFIVSKRKLDLYSSTVPDVPCQPDLIIAWTMETVLRWRTPRDGLADN